MLTKLKEEFYKLIKGLGYNVTDNGRYEEQFPWLMLKTSGMKSYVSHDVKFDNITFTLDVFSTYTGEKEIMDIGENILNNINSLRQEVPEITHIYLASCQILNDKKTGPVRQHGVFKFAFALTSGLEAV